MWDDARSSTGSGDDLRRQAYLLTGDPARAEWLAQRALVASAQHSRRAGPAGAHEAARAELVRALIADARPGGHGDEPLPPGPHAGAWLALGGLPARRRAVLVLRYGEGLSEEQIAARMGGSTRTVHADVEAALLSLGPALSGAAEPARLVAAALADAGRRWDAGGYRPAAAPAAPARERSVPTAGRSSWSPVAASAADPRPDDGHDWWSSPSAGNDAAPALPRRRPGTGFTLDLPARGAAAADGVGRDGYGGLGAGRGDGTDPTPGTRGPGERWDGGDWPSGGWERRGFLAPMSTLPADGLPTNGLPAEGLAANGHDRPVPPADDPDEPSFAAAAFPLDEPSARRRLRTPTIIGAAALTTLVLGAAVILVPAALSNGGDQAQTPPAGAAASKTADVPAVPTRSVPRGLLDWPARGPLGDDQQVLTAATAAWKAKAPAAEAPTTAVSLLYAGELDGRHVAIVQALDKAGKPRVAQLSGYAPTAYRLIHAEPLMATAELLSFMPPDGRGGRLRVLVSPEGQAADGLLASDVSKKPLSRVPVNGDGVSDILPSPPGIPTCSRVVLMGLPAPLGRTGPRVLESGVVTADMLGAMMMEVEVGSSTLASGDDAVPQTVWYTDGQLLAKKARLGKAMVTVAALGPRLPGRPLSASDQRSLESRAYELRAGGKKLVGAIVTFGGRTICTTVSRVSPAQEGRLTAFALRCPVPSGSAGLVHVVGGADVQSVEVQLDPTRDPPGQAPYSTSVSRPASGATSGFAVLDVVPSAFPCGPGTVQATGSADASQPMRLPVFTP